MPVVINEFEAVIDPPPRAAEAPAPSPPPDASALEPKDVKPLLRVLEQRALRTWAH